MTARRTASRLATLAAVAVASMGAPLAHAAPAAGPNSANRFVIVIGGNAFTLNFGAGGLTVGFSGILQQGGAG